MMPASTNGGGQCATPGPTDVCKTPAPPAPFVPLPYPNMAMPTQAKGDTCSKKVKILSKKTLVKGTEIPISTGDEAGTIGGMVSSRFKGPCQYKTGSGRVLVEGKKMVHQCALIAQNGSNANMPAGMQVAPSQSKVTVMP